MSSLMSFASFLILLSVISLIRAEGADNLNVADFNENVELSSALSDELSKDTKRTQRFLKNIWKDLFNDCDYNNAGPSRPGYNAPLYSESQLFNPLRTLDPLGLFSRPACGTPTYVQPYGNGYYGQGPSYGYEGNKNYNEDTPTKYDKPQEVYEKPAPVYEPPQQVYEKPTPSYEKPEEVYEKPTATYEKPKEGYGKLAPSYEQPEPVYEKKDCGTDKCGSRPQVVYQPIIYVAPNLKGGKEKIYVQSKESFEEEIHSKDSKYEPQPEPVIYENEQKQVIYEQSEQSYIPPPPVEPVPHKDEQHVPPPPPPPSCTHSYGHLTIPVLGLAIPTTQNVPQIINYNVPAPSLNHQGCGNGNCGSSNPISYYNTGSYASVSSSQSLPGPVNHLRPAPMLPPAPIILTHADQPYRACPELFTEYNYHLAHMNSNRLY